MKAKHHLIIWVAGFAALIGVAFLLTQGAKKGHAAVAAANGGDAGLTTQYGTSSNTSPAETVINLYDNGSGAAPSVGTSSGSPAPSAFIPVDRPVRRPNTLFHPYSVPGRYGAL